MAENLKATNKEKLDPYPGLSGSKVCTFFTSMWLDHGEEQKMGKVMVLWTQDDISPTFASFVTFPLFLISLLSPAQDGHCSRLRL